MIVALRNFTCVAHAASSTSTVSTPLIEPDRTDVIGHILAHRVGPSTEHATDLHPVGPAQRRHDRVDRGGDRHRIHLPTLASTHFPADIIPATLRSGVISLGARRRSTQIDAIVSATGCGLVVTAASHPQDTIDVGLRRESVAVVITIWPAGRCAEQCRRPMVVEFGQHVVEHQHRRRSRPLGDQPMCGQAQRQRQRALLTLRRVRAARQAA